MASKTKKSDYFEIRLPRLKFGNTSINGYLVTTLIIFTFLLGMLTNKVLFLEKAANLAAAQPTNTQTAVSPTEVPLPQVVKVDNGKLPFLGQTNAKVTVVEFSDFQCPFCKRYFEDTHDQVLKQYVDTGKIKFYYRHYPLTSIHPNAQIAAEASECANEQNKFWGYHDLLFTNQTAWSELTGTDVTSTLTNYAGQLGLDTLQFGTCLNTHKYKDQVDSDLAAGNAVGVSGTPTFFVNGYRMVGAQPFASFQKVIDQELKK